VLFDGLLSLNDRGTHQAYYFTEEALNRCLGGCVAVYERLAQEGWDVTSNLRSANDALEECLVEDWAITVYTQRVVLDERFNYWARPGLWTKTHKISIHKR
jgi:hypothetical protein